jgi:hypothetical protein
VCDAFAHLARADRAFTGSREIRGTEATSEGFLHRVFDGSRLVRQTE